MSFADIDRCYVIAEIGVNHNGSIELAKELIDVAANCGADAAKFQTFAADELVTASARKARYQRDNTGHGDSQHAMLSALELSEQQFGEIREHCDSRGVEFLSTPFGIPQADMLERLGMTTFKVSSGDLTYHQMLAHIAAKGMPMIVSTGMATLDEVGAALAAIEAVNPVPVALLHCVSNYPAAPDTANLRAMDTMARAFGRPVGWSDHTLGSAVSNAAVALGASIVEKHITLDTAMAGPDHAASMEPEEFAAFVDGIRCVESALGDGVKRPDPSEADTASVARRSVVAIRDLAAGDVVTADDVAILRPGTGLQPHELPRVVGSRLRRAVRAEDPLTADDLYD